jgi:Alr-MurF fusion protein
LPISTNSKYLLTDSRTLSFPSESIFFAIKGPNHDGHNYLKELYLKGVKEFVIEEESIKPNLEKLISTFENCKFWKVTNSIVAMQQLVSEKRKLYEIPVIGITGSNGKTIIKEWLSQLLSNHFSIVKSPKSFNSQLGVPLSVWQINNSHTLGVFEAGISQPNEMANLEKVIQPTIGLFSNIGSAHDQYFESTFEKINEKLKLFEHVDSLIYCSSDSLLDDTIKDYLSVANPNCELLSWSFDNRHDLNFEIIKNESYTQIIFNDYGKRTSFDFPFLDDASIQNICHCIVLINHLNIDLNQINFRLRQLKSVSMRLELKEGINDCFLIDDSYNNDKIGLKLALDFMHQQKQKSNYVVILSDVLQTGENEKALYDEIAHLLKEKKVTKLIGVGSVISKNATCFSMESVFYSNTDSLIDSLNKIDISNSIVLVKGARKFEFEKIVNRLQLKNHETVLQINLDAIVNNLNYFRNLVGKNTRIMAMVKAFAYGAGNVEVASLLQFNSIDYLGVAYTDEGVHLRENGIYVPIMVMNPNEFDYHKIVDYTLEPEMYSLNKLRKFSEFVENQNSISKIHIKLDTGMHRLGFTNSEILELIHILKSNPNLIVTSIFSHLAAADDKSFDDYTELQISKFFEMAGQISNAIGYNPMKHILNSAGIERFSDYKMDMVRLGIGLYGVSAKKHERDNLQIVGTLKTRISQVKFLEQTDTVGYGRKGKLLKKSKIATIAIGYADGYDRRFGNGIGKVQIKGALCPTIGNICMDMTMVDVSIIDATEGDEAIVFGENPSIYNLAENINTIPYEILTNVGERVKRIFYKD